MSWLSETLGFDDADRRRRAQDAAESDRLAAIAEKDRLAGITGQNDLGALNASLQNLASSQQNRDYSLAKNKAEAMGGSYGFDSNGDGTIGTGETVNVNGQQSLAGRNATHQLAMDNSRGLSNSTLSGGATARYSKNLNDTLLNLGNQNVMQGNQDKANLATQAATLGNQAGKQFTLDPTTGKYVMA